MHALSHTLALGALDASKRRGGLSGDFASGAPGGPMPWAVVESSDWMHALTNVHLLANATCPDGWLEMMASQKSSIYNSEVCYFDRWGGGPVHDMVLAFEKEHEYTLRTFFGVQNCEALPEEKLPHLGTRGYITQLWRELAPDDWHSDYCRPAEGDRLKLSVIGYPHAEWHERWGGLTEFSTTDWCGAASTASPEELSAAAKEFDVALRVAPSPDRTVIFDGRVAHRATRPSKSFRSAAAPGVPAGRRYSVVLQVQCDVIPPSRAGGFERRGLPEGAGHEGRAGAGGSARRHGPEPAAGRAAPVARVEDRADDAKIVDGLEVDRVKVEVGGGTESSTHRRYRRKRR